MKDRSIVNVNKSSNLQKLTFAFKFKNKFSNTELFCGPAYRLYNAIKIYDPTQLLSIMVYLNASKGCNVIGMFIDKTQQNQ